MSDARNEILERIRSALGPSPVTPEPQRDYARAPLQGRGDAEVFAQAVEEYAATVHRTTPAEAADVVARLVAGSSVVVPHDLPTQYVVEGAAVDDPAAPLTPRELDGIRSVVTLGRLGIAATGTVVLDAGPGQGRRAVTLVPDHHVCVLLESQVVDTVPQAFTVLGTDRPLTLISGPSAPSDIELDRVEGVHGPRTLDVVLVAD